MADTFFLFAQWSEEDDTRTSKVAKGKGKTRGKMEKPENVLRSKTTNRQTASKLRLLMLLYQGWYLHKEKETSFLTLFMANFG